MWWSDSPSSLLVSRSVKLQNHYFFPLSIIFLPPALTAFLPPKYFFLKHSPPSACAAISAEHPNSFQEKGATPAASLLPQLPFTPLSLQTALSSANPFLQAPRATPSALLPFPTFSRSCWSAVTTPSPGMAAKARCLTKLAAFCLVLMFLLSCPAREHLQPSRTC